MFGNTYPIVEHEMALSERVRDRGLADYLRWEYPTGDRLSVVLSARGGALLARGPRKARRSLLRRIRAWAKGRTSIADVRVRAIEDPASE